MKIKPPLPPSPIGRKQTLDPPHYYLVAVILIQTVVFSGVLYIISLHAVFRISPLSSPIAIHCTRNILLDKELLCNMLC